MRRTRPWRRGLSRARAFAASASCRSTRCVGRRSRRLVRRVSGEVWWYREYELFVCILQSYALPKIGILVRTSKNLASYSDPFTTA